MIFTSYFGNLRNLPYNVIPISIALKTPNWFKGLRYEKLAPKEEDFLKWKKDKNNENYIKNYNAHVLDNLSRSDVIQDLYDLLSPTIKKFLKKSGTHIWNNKHFHIALICYEVPDDFCHRHITADWLNEDMYDVKEWITRPIQPINIIVAGSRGFTDYNSGKQAILSVIKGLLCKNPCEPFEITTEPEFITFIGGEARGADMVGKEFAKEFNFPYKGYPANWDEYGKSAGYHRNVEMATESLYNDAYGVLIAFWDGASKGTKHMIDIAISHKLEIHVFKV